MKSLTFRIGLLIAAFVLSIIAFNACKKQDVKKQASSEPAQVDAAMFERIKKSILESKQPVSFTVPVNQKADDIYFSDASDNKIYKDDLRKMLKTGRTSVCGAQYDGNGDPVEEMFPLDFQLGLEGFGSLPCGPTTDYQMSFTWFLAVHHDIRESNAYGAGGALIKSRFTLKLKNASGTVIATYSNIPIPTEKITNNGDYLFDNTRTLFSVLGTISVPANVASNAASGSVTVSLATDCNLTPQLSGTFSKPFVDLNTLPCYRTDKVWINPNTTGDGKPSVVGTFAVCGPPSGFVSANSHEIQYRQKDNAGSDSWDLQGSPIYPSPTSVLTINTYTGYEPLRNVVLGKTWLVRYRNAPPSGCNPSAPWMVEKWNF